MLFNNNNPFIGINRNPLVFSLYTQYFSDNSSIPPPPVFFLRITDDGDLRITDDGDDRITDD